MYANKPKSKYRQFKVSELISQRPEPRSKVSGKVILRSKSKSLQAECINLSASGILVIAERPVFLKGSIVIVEFFPSSDMASFKQKAKITRCEVKETQKIEYGLQFIEK